MQLSIVIASTRPGRKGRRVADWFIDIARPHPDFDIDVIDLAELNLPILDEPRHPRFAQYEHDHTRAWSRRIDPADAYVFVTPEYDHGAPASLVNALQFLVREWAYKPAGFVSYGGVSAGLRSVQMTKSILTALRVMPIPEAVSIPFFAQHFDEEGGGFDPGEVQVKAAAVMLDELARWAAALQPLRAQR